MAAQAYSHYFCFDRGVRHRTHQHEPLINQYSDITHAVNKIMSIICHTVDPFSAKKFMGVGLPHLHVHDVATEGTAIVAAHPALI